MAKLTLPLLLTLLIQALASPIEVHPETIALTVPQGFSKILFQDDFSTQSPGSPPSPSKWTIDTGTNYPGGPNNWGTHEVESYVSSTSNLAVTSSGTLSITPQLKNGRWTSARIETVSGYDFACPAGGKVRVEASIKLGNADPSTQMGIWPAFWLLGADFRGKYNNWPSVGEIDILESVNGAPTTWQVVHCGSSGQGGPCNEPSGISGTSAFSRGVWHVVSVDIDRTNGGDWRGEKMSWMVDGKETFAVTGARVGDEGAWKALAANAKFLVLNVAVGGDFPDNAANDGLVKTPTEQTVGGEGAGIEVRYVAVYST